MFVAINVLKATKKTPKRATWINFFLWDTILHRLSLEMSLFTVHNRSGMYNIPKTFQLPFVENKNCKIWF